MSDRHQLQHYAILAGTIWLTLIANQCLAGAGETNIGLLPPFLSALTTFCKPDLNSKSEVHPQHSRGADTVMPLARKFLQAMRRQPIKRPALCRKLATKEALQRITRAYNEFRAVAPLEFRGLQPTEKMLPPGIHSDHELTSFSLPYRVALHAPRLDVIEDFDDVLNDNLFLYYSVTYQDLTWGRVTAIYRGLDEGQSLVFSPNDQALFDPLGRFHAMEGPIIVDFGIVESDGEDITLLRELSAAVIDVAAEAFTASLPLHATARHDLREETQRLMNAVLALDADDRLFTGSLLIAPLDALTILGEEQMVESSLEFFGERLLSRFGYRLWFRLLRGD